MRIFTWEILLHGPVKSLKRCASIQGQPGVSIPLSERFFLRAQALVRMSDAVYIAVTTETRKILVESGVRAVYRGPHETSLFSDRCRPALYVFFSTGSQPGRVRGQLH